MLRWHRELFRRIWRRKSKPHQKQGRPPLTDDLVALIKRIVKENLTWGAERIRGELLKLGIRVGKSTIQRYMNDERGSRASKQDWATFLRNHASQIWACDFLQTFDIFFRTVFVFVVIKLRSRRVVHFGVTRNPTDAWVAQQLREAMLYGEGPRFLIRDNDSKYGASFVRVAAGTGIEVLKTSYRAPRANAICHARPHQGIEQSIPCQPERPEAPPVGGKVASRPVLRGLHHDYFWQAAESDAQTTSQLSGYFH